MITLAGLALGALAGLAVLERVVRSSVWGAALVVPAAVLGEAGLLGFGLSAGPLNVYPGDVLLALLLAAAVARLLRAERLTGAQLLLLALLAIVVVSIAQGAGDHGPAAAVNEARKFLYFIGMALYFSTVPWRRDLLERIAAVWLLGCAGLLLLALVRWGALLVGVTADSGLLHNPGAGLGQPFRVLTAGPTLMLAQGLIVLLAAWRSAQTPRWVAPAGIGLLLAIVLLQHRTVWVVLLVAFGVLALRDPRLGRKVGSAVLAAGLVISVLMLAVFDDGALSLEDELATAATNVQTWEWRMAGWRALLDQRGPDGVEEHLLGAPFGGGFQRLYDGRVVDVTPHNFYVEGYVRIGLLGMGLLLLLYARVAARAATTPLDAGGLELDDVVLLLVLSHVVYFIPYSPHLEQSVLLGLLAAALSALPVSAQHAAVARPGGGLS
jgi:hypothetical protein